MRTKLAVFVAIALALAACGGGDVITDPTGGDTPVSSPDTTVAPGPGTTSTPGTTAPVEGSPPEDNPAPIGWLEGRFFVEGVDLVIMESYPIQVRLDVSGTVPTPCNEPFWRITDDRETLAVELFTASDPDVACAQVIADAEIQIPLGSWAGESRSVELDGELVGSFES